MSWRPKNWPKDPCKDCELKDEDEYGLVCDIACGKFSAYTNYNKGADDLLKMMKEQGFYVSSGCWDKYP